MRFYKTDNINHPMIYDSVTHEEHIFLYDLLPIMNDLAEENKKLKASKKKFCENCEYIKDQWSCKIPNYAPNYQSRGEWDTKTDSCTRHEFKKKEVE